MKKIILSFFIGMLCTTIMAQQLPYQNASLPVTARIQDLLQRMTLQEKVAQMCQFVGIEHQKEAYVRNKGKEPAANDDASSFYKGISFDSLETMIRNGKIGSLLHVVTAKESNAMQRLALKSRLKIPLIIGIDAIHGNAMVSGCSVFPTPIGLAGTFNPVLIEQIGQATAKEMRATGSHWTFTPNLDIARDARWGRVGETFGEDPLLVSKMGVAMVKGLQGAHMEGQNAVTSCIKHLIGGGQSINGLNGAPTDISMRTLWEVHLPPYKAAIDAGAFTAMTAHNELNGVPCHANTYLMTKVLRNQWGFKGFFVSDWMDIERLNTVHHVAKDQKEAVYQTVMAGMDMHMHGPGFLEPLVELVQEGRVPMATIDRAVKKILEAKFKLGLFEQPFVPEGNTSEWTKNTAHQQLALQAARESIVLLKNEGHLLPIDPSIYKKILVTGPLADHQTILGDWTLLQPDDQVTTVLEGIRQQAPQGVSVEHVSTGTVKKIDTAAIRSAMRSAKESDLVVVVVGENSLRYDIKEKTSGENIDRDAIELIGQQSELLKKLASTGKPLVIVLINSRPLAVTEKSNALLEAWEPGNLGGQALAEILFGKINPSGKLPISIPRSTGQIPTYYNVKPSNYFHKYIETQSSSLYDFGFGLNYSTCVIDTIQLDKKTIRKNESVYVRGSLKNTGAYDAVEVVQLYIKDDVSSITRPIKELKDFKRIAVSKGDRVDFNFQITPAALSFLDDQMRSTIEAGTFTIMVGLSSNDSDLKKCILNVE